MIGLTPQALNAATRKAPFPARFVALGYQTCEEARAYFRGEPVILFEEIEDWLEFNLPGDRSMAARDEFRGSLLVAISHPVDQVTFKLAWSGRLLLYRAGPF